MDLTAIPEANPNIVFQEFPLEGAVLVNLDTGGSLALNSSGCVLWRLVDGRRKVLDIICGIERSFKQVPESVASDVVSLLDALVEDGFVGHEILPRASLQSDSAKSEPKHQSFSAPKRYQANSVVSCADEGDDGALLFNPDTDEAVAINPSGCALWNYLCVPRTMEEITAHLAATFRDVHVEQAVQDADKFIHALMPDIVLEVIDVA
jgi:hypothetical protein